MKRKLASLFLALALCMGLAVPAFAAAVPASNQTLTSSKDSTGSFEIQRTKASKATVLVYPAGTEFKLDSRGIQGSAILLNADYTEGKSVADLWDSSMSFTLPKDSNIYLLKIMNMDFANEYIYVSSTGATAPATPVEPEKPADPGKAVASDAVGKTQLKSDMFTYTLSQPVAEVKEYADYDGSAITVYFVPDGTVVTPPKGRVLAPLYYDEYIDGIGFIGGPGDYCKSLTVELADGASQFYQVGSVSAEAAEEAWYPPEDNGIYLASTTAKAPATPDEPPFPDVPKGEWYYDFVCQVKEKKLFGGFQDGTFGPKKNMTVNQFFAVLYQFSGESRTITSMDDYMTWAKEKNLIPSAMQSVITSNAAITRQQMATAFGAFLKAYNVNYTPVTTEAANFTDQSSIAGYAQDGVAACWKAGIMGGVGNNAFSPDSTATRAQVAVTMIQMARVMGR